MYLWCLRFYHDFTLFLLPSACGSIMIDVIYGEAEGARRDEYIHKADEAIEALCTAGNIGTFLVDILPSCKFVWSYID